MTKAPRSGFAWLGGAHARAVPPPSIAASFDSLSNDCITNVLSFLPFEDMNNMPMCDQACREARSNEPLGQARAGAIVCSEMMTAPSIYNAIVARE